jgi:hypothetical protein
VNIQLSLLCTIIYRQISDSKDKKPNASNMSRNERITAQIPAQEVQESHHYGVKYRNSF